MEFEEARPFLERHHRGVITTYRPNGAMHASIVVCGAYQGHAAFVIVRGTSVKARHLRRDPRCRRMLREVYRACGDKDHPDWEEYDRAMRAQDAVIVLVRPQQVYGLVR